jgi:hypothetical protein
MTASHRLGASANKETLSCCFSGRKRQYMLIARIWNCSFSAAAKLIHKGLGKPRSTAGPGAREVPSSNLGASTNPLGVALHVTVNT